MLPFASVKLKHGKDFWNETLAYAKLMPEIGDDSATVFCKHYVSKKIPIPMDNQSEVSVSRFVFLEPDATWLSLMTVNYYSVPFSFNVGNISQIRSKEMKGQAVTNLAASLEGSAPGVLITQKNGMPTAGFSFEMRGPGSIQSGKDPYIIVDHVPLSANNGNISNIGSGSAAQTYSPLSLINPEDIETVQFLKDAEATAIYGSCGANGVLLITTKKASRGARFGLNITGGVSNATTQMNLLNTQQYVAMRKEAFLNDGVQMNNAADIKLWDTTRYTNFPKTLSNQTGRYNRLDGTFSSVGTNNSLRLAGHWLHQTVSFPGSLPYDNGSLQGNLIHHSDNGKFTIQGSAIYSRAWGRQYVYNLMDLESLSPNAPPFKDPNGNLQFSATGLGFNNPEGQMLDIYRSNAGNLLGDIYLQWEFSPHWTLKNNLGYNHIHLKERSEIPMKSLDPASYPPPTGTAYSAETDYRRWIVEPQIERKDNIGKFRFQHLAGFSLQTQHKEASSFIGLNYTSDALLAQPSQAGTIIPRLDQTDYKYAGVYGRSNVMYDSSYIVSLMARRDGSSRFGPGRQYGNFGAAGIGWIFSNIDSFNKRLPFISFGKIRASIGVTGNDQIGDYQYRSIYNNNIPADQGRAAYYPTNLANADLKWEKVIKREVGLELGFLQDKVFFTTSYYNNRASDQVLLYSMPFQSGLATALRNSGAVIGMTGWEFSAQAQIPGSKDFKWTTSFNLSLPKNRLLAFPNLSNYALANSLMIGRSLNAVKAYKYTGVDPLTGIYQFADVNRDGQVNDSDKVYAGNLDARMYAGWNNMVRIGDWQIDIQMTLRMQSGRDYQSVIFNQAAPGMLGGGLLSNQSVAVMDRWQRPGDKARYQKFTTGADPAAYEAFQKFLVSDALLVNASYMRLKAVTISRKLPERWLKKMGCLDARAYLQAQNLFTITPYKGLDPETQINAVDGERQSLNLPPMRTIAIGINFNFK